MTEIIELNVGGTHYTTYKSTLTSIPDTMLRSMFSGKFTNNLDAKGRYFIDRDGEPFKYILNYLRDGKIDFSIGRDLLQRLRKEAEYFGLAKLVEEIDSDAKSVYKTYHVDHSKGDLEKLSNDGYEIILRYKQRPSSDLFLVKKKNR